MSLLLTLVLAFHFPLVKLYSDLGCREAFRAIGVWARGLGWVSTKTLKVALKMRTIWVILCLQLGKKLFTVNKEFSIEEPLKIVEGPRPIYG